MLIFLLMDVLFSKVLPLVPRLRNLRKLAMPNLVVSAWIRVSVFTTHESSRKGDKFYTVASNELKESARPLPGETEPDLDDLDNEVPVRLLDDFAIYDWDTLRLVPIEDLLDLGPSTHYGASGFARPWTDDGTDDDCDDDISSPLAIKLAPIIELNVHHFTPLTGSLDA